MTEQTQTDTNPFKGISDTVFSNLMGAFDANRDGQVTHSEFVAGLDRSKDSQSGVMREIMEVFFHILSGSSGMVDVAASADKAPLAVRQAFVQVTGRDPVSLSK